MPEERESPEQAARREGGRLLAWFVACAAVVSVLILLAPLSSFSSITPLAPVPPVERGDPKSGDHGRRLLEQSAPASPVPAAPLGRHSEGLAIEPHFVSSI